MLFLSVQFRKELSSFLFSARLESLQNNGCLTKIELETFKAMCGLQPISPTNVGDIINLGQDGSSTKECLKQSERIRVRQLLLGPVLYSK